MSTKLTRNTGKKGFTLIELLIVFVIMSLLTGLGIGAFMTSRLRARDAARKSHLESIARALEVYYNDYGYYPDFEYVDYIYGQISVDGTNGLNWGSSFVGTDGTIYMAELPKDPGAFVYNYQRLGTAPNYQYVLYARLENVEDAAVPVVGGAPGRYGATCTADQTLHCNYVITSSNFSKAGIATHEE